MPAHLNSDEETMTPDQCFDEMAVALGLPKDTGYIDILAEVKMKNDQLKIMEDIHSGDMKIVKMLKEKWNEEQKKNEELKKMLGDLPDNIKWIPSAEAWTFSDDEGPDSP